MVTHRPLTFTTKVSNPTHTRLAAFLEQQRLLYSAALEERMGCYRKTGHALTAYDQYTSLTGLRMDVPFSQDDLKCQRSALVTRDRAFRLLPPGAGGAEAGPPALQIARPRHPVIQYVNTPAETVRPLAGTLHQRQWGVPIHGHPHRRGAAGVGRPDAPTGGCATSGRIS